MELSSNLILLTKHYMGDLTQGFDGLCFERPARSKCQRAASVSAQQVSARSKCQRAARARARALRASGALGL